MRAAALLLLFIATSDAFSLGGGVRAFGLKRPQQVLRSTSDGQGISSSKEALDAIKHIELQRALGIKNIDDSPVPPDPTPSPAQPPLPSSEVSTLPTSELPPPTFNLPKSDVPSINPTAALPPLPRQRRNYLAASMMLGPLLLKLCCVIAVKIFMDAVVTPIFVVTRWAGRAVREPWRRLGKKEKRG
mmetsp:Transcript_20520/g.41057  ORF Transcript_20520/g.41057 Transcript_20520/m.41057 type:complete len:187 (-) Transcript_20520:135-695(-)|eukprot:CAMPEP_0182472644 /NCGR_PEP_ID=MMETSP1319-20130603/22562_1 /TAXON_ID=172717 /ORGANISM="Bolidomonas pacifica, Strain RCC208" /LENGTH=186 /DNA_ID=CAMNT_0024673369 /DNA_START=186 /DNA_END=746 /DNA_ORIENTATION=-